jgi:hypothetical protein
MRKTGLFALAATFAAALGTTPAHSQARCVIGTTITVTGTIDSAYQDKTTDGSQTWTIEVRSQGRGQCAVDELWGNGQLPAACADGRTFRATGVYDDDPDLELLFLDAILAVRSVACR